MANPTFVAIPGTARVPQRGTSRRGATGAADPIEVTLRLRRRAPLPVAAMQATLAPTARQYMTRAEMAAAHGATDADVAAVESFARSHGLTVVGSSTARRSVMLSGTASQFNAAFRITLETWSHPRVGSYRTHAAPISMPAEMVTIVEGVFGLDTRPFARPHFRILPAATAGFAGYTGAQVAKFYDFPADVDGTGEVVGILEFGGGYREADLTTYFQASGLPLPSVTSVSVDGGTNAPSTIDGADPEVMLDIEVIARVAPKAAIVVYFAPDASERSFIDAITAAVHDTTHNPSVISISWGGPESETGVALQKSFDEALQTAAALGITVTIASGDNGAADEGPNEWDGVPHADFPASSPHALACGGTQITVTGTTLSAEVAWNEHVTDTQNDSFGASGGGFSAVFPTPDYQTTIAAVAATKMRGVPDVAADADPRSGYHVRVDGQDITVGGTSAVAPLWAGLIALINQSLGAKAGFVNALLYANPTALRDITSGNNKVGSASVGYDAGAGWDACTGLGSPNGTKLLAALRGASTVA
jgi:kumamolisin